ncbi:DNA helicase [Bacteriovorax sp. PP10]|uniref:DNA helicase n=1 Tax=Bacteriovorax antarcticus TaxID=3088717 RepID=A0ABU5VS18_9BACT|nr:DNA helicase [Bacteriovorax sp. PP10]MEA9355154.1 DNA helicase [Bacteriovorax sp. PP10]
MKLSAPIHVLKAEAQLLKKEKSITNTEALDLIAKREGFDSWSLLQSKKDDMFPKSYNEILGFFNPGDIVLIGARPSKGKTSFTIGLFVQAIQKKAAKNFCFSLSEVHKDIAKRMAVYDESLGENNAYFELDYSNDISADYIIEKTKKSISKGSLIVIDYLQLLDEKRSNPPLQVQVEKLKLYAKEKECVVVFISQLDRELENRADKKPTMGDIRLPNPLELKFFNKIMFLHKEDDKSSVADVLFYRPKEFSFKVGWDSSSSKLYSI